MPYRLGWIRTHARILNGNMLGADRPLLLSVSVLLRGARIAAALLSAALAAPAGAQDLLLEARVDRSTIRENESFTYVLRAVGQVRREPDFAPFVPTFDILQRYRKNEKTVDGQTQFITEWLLQLMPRAPGRLALPPIGLAGAVSNAIEIEVLPALAGDVPQDIFLEVEAAPLDPYVQSEVIYTLRLFRAISTGSSTLTPAPRVRGGEALIERLGGDREYQVVRDDRNFVVIERRYAIFPQAPGELSIEPVTFNAVVTERSGHATVRPYRTESLALAVRPRSTPPAGFSDAAWLPARSLTLSEQWSGAGDELVAGVPRTRTVTLQAEGLPQTHLPELRLPRTGGVWHYADQPEISREATEAGLRVRRVERFVVLAQTPGEIRLPGVEIPWWNVVEQRWEVARLEPRALTVVPNPEPTVTAAAESPANPIDAPSPGRPGAVGLWQVVSGGLAVGWLATLALWSRSRARSGTIRPADGR